MKLWSTMKKQSIAARVICGHHGSWLPIAVTISKTVPLANTPKRVPKIFPTPPVSNVPPIIDAAIASISRPVAC